jgi:hypothetical protein
MLSYLHVVTYHTILITRSATEDWLTGRGLQPVHSFSFPLSFRHPAVSSHCLVPSPADYVIYYMKTTIVGRAYDDISPACYRRLDHSSLSYRPIF